MTSIVCPPHKAPARDTGSIRSYCSTSENPCDSGNVANVHTDKLANLFQTVGLDVMPTNQPTNHTYHTSIHVPKSLHEHCIVVKCVTAAGPCSMPVAHRYKKKTSLPIYTSLVSSRVLLFPTAAGRAYNKRVAGRASCRGISSMRSPRYDWFFVDQ